MKKTILFIVFATATLLSQGQALKTPAPSPTQKVTQDFGIGTIELSYSRPSAKGRKVYGDLVPFGSMWRTGANAPTRIKTSRDITMGGQKLPTGEYSIFTIPGEKEWEIIINKDPEKKNVFEYNKEDDVIRFKVPTQRLADNVETFSIDFNNITNTTADLQMRWANTLVSIPLTTSFHDDVMKQIEEVMKKDTRPYNAAATYYLENGGDKNKALEWYKKGVEINPKAYWILFGQAKCELALGKKVEALATAAKALAVAKEEGDESYVKNIQAFLDKNKK